MIKNWIWLNNDNNKDEHVDFLDFFDGEKDKEYFLDISVSGDYIAYLNGKRVGYGQYRDYEHYKVKDRLNLSEFIKSGENRLCIRTWHTGGNTFTNAIKKAGLWFSVSCDGKPILSSSESTLCRLSKDYISHREVAITPQLGYDYCYDAVSYDGFLTAGDSGFTKAVRSDLRTENVYPRPNKKLIELPFVGGKIVQQGVFDWSEGKTTAQKMMRAGLAFRPKNEIVEEKNGMTVVHTEENCDGIYLIFDLGQEEVGNLTFDVETPKETVLHVGYGEHLDAGRVSTELSVRSFCVEYRAKAGRQFFSGEFRRFGLRYLTLFVCGKDISITKFGITPVRYPLKETEFSTGDYLRDKIYRTSVRTLELCIHEAYEDCPWREQAFYNMDSRNQMLCGYYAFNEYEMPRASLELVSQGLRDDGLLSIVFPAGSDLPIPSFNLIVFTQFKEYLMYSKDEKFIIEKENFLDTLIKTFIDKSDERCLLPNFPSPCWNFYEWQTTLSGNGHERGYEAPLSAFFSFALGEYAELLSMLGKEDKAKGLKALQDKVNAAIRKTFFVEKDGLFKTFSAAEEPYSVLVNALSVLCGASDGLNLARIEEILKGQNADGIYDCTLSMSIFRYDALLKISEDNAGYILSDIDENYYEMLASGATTFWETAKGAADFSGAGSLCHGWSALPILYYNKLIR
ncbi:MAG: family 78 glycoside hydrolase catalytic domain [Clostridia bacterium]|nr:family 78 glycoside hydrolase catalytic domain [Clostridia bacterium]